MNKILIQVQQLRRLLTVIAVAIITASSSFVYAQRFPVGIVSVQDTTKGFQLGIISSIAEEGGHGVQLAGVSNMSAHTFNGLQLSGVSNISSGMDRGLQLSGILNVSSGMMRGWQWGAVNYADSLNGVQIGAFNIARRHPEGWQVGLINLSYDTIGHKIGLVNINPSTVIDLMMYGGSSTKTNLAVRYRNKSTYNVIGVGTHFMGLDSKFSGTIFYRLGQYWQLSPKWSLSGDIGYYHVETFSKDNSGFSIKSKTQLDFGTFGRFILNAKYFRLYTWKGYEDKDLQAYADGTKDLHYLNVQGDRSNAALLVVNPVMEMHLARQWSITLSGTYYSRRTFYKYYPTVHANTFETKPTSA